MRSHVLLLLLAALVVAGFLSAVDWGGTDAVGFTVAAAFAAAFLILLFLLWKESVRQLRAAEAAEASAQSSADSYRALFDSMSDAVVVADVDGQVIDANPAATALFSPDQEPLYGMAADDLQTADPETGETVGCRRDGSTFPQEVRISDVDYLGNPAKLSLIRDISERRAAERVVRESEARYRVVAEQTGTMVYELDMASGAVDWSGAVGAITGYAEDELAQFDAQRWTELVHESDRDEMLAHVERARRSGLPLQVEYRFRHRSGKWLWLEQRGVYLTDERGRPYRLLGSVADITERKRITSEMTWQASHDALTGLYNRQEFESRVKQLLGDRRARRSPNALLYIDLDQFKVVNDTCGHQAGDELLKQLTGMMLTRVRDTDTLARLGGDEFGVLLTDCTVENAVEVANNLIRMVNEFRFHWDEKLFTIGASIGLVEIDDSTEDAAVLFSAADSACYAAKDSGRNRTVVYHHGDEDIAERRGQMTLVSRITRALESGAFALHFQRIEPLNPPSGVDHFELLLRMRDADTGQVMPDVFIPAAERFNLMPSLDRWAIRTAFSQLESMFSARRGWRGLAALNLSGTTLGSDGFSEFVTGLFDEFAVPPEAICFEITETAAIANLNTARAFIDAMHGLGCRIALDDFGSGLSSFAYLKALPVNFLKIDGTFIQDVVEDSTDRAMVEAIVRVGQAMNIRTIAEFVDSTAIRDLLQELGVDYVQGYAVHRPEPWHPNA